MGTFKFYDDESSSFEDESFESSSLEDFESSSIEEIVKKKPKPRGRKDALDTEDEETKPIGLLALIGLILVAGHNVFVNGFF